ncbi:MAG TPA: hypothetical protein DHW82_09500 [Spirochaetia bacterium]|nr:MAG: hypothetical protein A2Y41_05410 [Spirochaetes bacterium GWB1_36_13]HCL57225.1 hypothetical protein [Spirochaetia bacterium]
MDTLLTALFLLLASAFFSSSETALFLVNSKKTAKNKMLLHVLKRPFVLLNTIIIGNTLVNIVFSGIVENFFSNTVYSEIPYKELKIFLGILSTALILLIFGEVLPKNLALKKAQKLSNLVAYPIYLLRQILFVPAFLVGRSTYHLTRLFAADEEKGFSKSEIKYVIALSREKGILTPDEAELIQKIIRFSHTEIKNLLLPRNQLIALSEEETLQKVWEVMKTEYFSKLLIYKENIDNIIGFIHLKDILNFKEDLKSKRIKNTLSLLREIHFIPESKNPVDALKILRMKKVSFAAVLDEYGGTSGIITINGILRHIIGESVEDSVKKTNDIQKIDANTLIIHHTADITLARIKKIFQIEKEWHNEEDKIIRFLLEKFDRIPAEKDILQSLGLNWEILEVSNHAVKKIKVTRG